MVDSRRWDERIARARVLAGRHPDAAELLAFYAALAACQQALAMRWAAAFDGRPAATSWRGSLDERAVLDAVPEMLTCLERVAPPDLAAAVEALRRHDADRWRTWLDESLASAGAASREDAPRQLVIEALLQPMAEVMAGERGSPPGAGDVNRCPFCDRSPVAGVLREEGHGAKRTLLCSCCLREWPFQRLVCPGCGERTFDKLPVYTADQFPAARIDACETCRTYIKTIDASKDGLAIPVVDDIATVALDLWARERGYVRLQGNLLRT